MSESCWVVEVSVGAVGLDELLEGCCEEAGLGHLRPRACL